MERRIFTFAELGAFFSADAIISSGMQAVTSVRIKYPQLDKLSSEELEAIPLVELNTNGALASEKVVWSLLVDGAYIGVCPFIRLGKIIVYEFSSDDIGKTFESGEFTNGYTFLDEEYGKILKRTLAIVK